MTRFLGYIALTAGAVWLLLTQTGSERLMVAVTNQEIVAIPQEYMAWVKPSVLALYGLLCGYIFRRRREWDVEEKSLKETTVTAPKGTTVALTDVVNAQNKALLDIRSKIDNLANTVRVNNAPSDASGTLKGMQNLLSQLAISTPISTDHVQSLLRLRQAVIALEQIQRDDNGDERDLSSLTEVLESVEEIASKLQEENIFDIGDADVRLGKLDNAISALENIRFDGNEDERDFDDIDTLASSVGDVARTIKGIEVDDVTTVVARLNAVDNAISALETAAIDGDGDRRNFDDIDELADSIATLSKKLKGLAA